MNSEAPYRDQAERLRQRIVRNKNSNMESGLPPRSSQHAKKKSRTKLKMKYPVIRLLVFFFLLMIVSIVAATMYLPGDSERNVPVINDGFESIRVQSGDNRE
ncbi:hypothetical protein [Bacillus massilinigeriensis]|uniref:hypothetical protein n=1 Tax=Bacillus mediterraneensis TaxID=1805474 RepID=UPI0008F88637|nr:hypothetical protein [Bacillus mediterraneensis]